MPEGGPGCPNIGGYYGVVGRIANALRLVYKTDWVVSLVVGIDVPHAHVWLVPRFDDDGHGDFIDLTNIKKVSEREMNETAEKIKKAIT